MPIVAIVKSLPSVPRKEEAKELAGHLLPELTELWIEHHGSFIAGIRFQLLGFPPGFYEPASRGVVRDDTEGLDAVGVRWLFAMTDEVPPPGTPSEIGLWTLHPDPDFFPDGV